MNDFVKNTVTLSYEMFGSWMFVVGANTPFIFHTQLPERMDPIRQEIINTVSEASRSLDEEMTSVTFTQGYKGHPSSYLFVVVPIGDIESEYGSLAIVQT